MHIFTIVITSVHPHIGLAFCHCNIPGPDAPVDLTPAKDLSEVEFQSVPSAAAVKQDILLPPEGAVATEEGEAETSKPLKNNLTEDKEMELMDAHEEGAQTEGKELNFYISENQTH